MPKDYGRPVGIIMPLKLFREYENVAFEVGARHGDTMASLPVLFRIHKEIFFQFYDGCDAVTRRRLEFYVDFMDRPWTEKDVEIRVFVSTPVSVKDKETWFLDHVLLMGAYMAHRVRQGRLPVRELQRLCPPAFLYPIYHGTTA